MNSWLKIQRGNLPLIVSIPHAGTEIPAEIAENLANTALATKDADFYIDKLYGFAAELGATVVSTAIARTVIDVNRDPSGHSLYPGQATTALCPVDTFDGESLYPNGRAPSDDEIARRRASWFQPYHDALKGEIVRLRQEHGVVVVYDAHSIRSRITRLFDGELPQFNIGTNDGRSCATALTAAVEGICDSSGHSRATNARFKGGWITRHYGSPETGVHAIQMELAMRGYLQEASGGVWPPPWNPTLAAAIQRPLKSVLQACIHFAKGLQPLGVVR